MTRLFCLCLSLLLLYLMTVSITTTKTQLNNKKYVPKKEARIKVDWKYV